HGLDCRDSPTLSVRIATSCPQQCKEGQGMNPVKIQKARTRVTDLRNRLHDINNLLHSVASVRLDGSTRDNLALAIRSIHAVRDDLEAVCDEHLTDWSV
ncbi:MAG: hypothetical protein ABIP38_10445, partial [Steroidobacteraceae bacterium]